MIYNPTYQAANHRSGSQKHLLSAYRADIQNMNISMSSSVSPHQENMWDQEIWDEKGILIYGSSWRWEF